jgi:hypothetical protein
MIASPGIGSLSEPGSDLPMGFAESDILLVVRGFVPPCNTHQVTTIEGNTFRKSSGKLRASMLVLLTSWRDGFMQLERSVFSP